MRTCVHACMTVCVHVCVQVCALVLLLLVFLQSTLGSQPCVEDGHYIIIIDTHIQVFCYLEEACNSCSTTLVTMHSSHDTTSLDVSAPCVVGDTLQATKHTISSLQNKYTKWVTSYISSSLQSKYTQKKSVTPVQFCSSNTKNGSQVIPIQVCDPNTQKWLQVTPVQVCSPDTQNRSQVTPVQVRSPNTQNSSAVQIHKIRHRLHQFKSVVQIHKMGHGLLQFRNQWWVSSLKTLHFLEDSAVSFSCCLEDRSTHRMFRSRQYPCAWEGTYLYTSFHLSDIFQYCP